MQVLVLVLVRGYKKGNYLVQNYSTFLLISPSSVLAMAGVQSSRSRTTRNKGVATKAAEKKRAHRHAETSKDLSWAGDGSQERPSHGGEHAEPTELDSLSLNGMPDQLNKHLNKQKEFIHGLMELLKESLDDMPIELNE